MTPPHLLFDARRHERGEPPGHQLGPERGVHDVEGLQVLLVPEVPTRRRLAGG